MPVEQRALVWQQAVDRTGGRPTAAVLKEIIDETFNMTKGDVGAAATTPSHCDIGSETGIEKSGEPSSPANADASWSVQPRQGNGTATLVVDVRAEPPRQTPVEVPTSIAAADVQSPPAPESNHDQEQCRTPAATKARLAELHRGLVENTKEILEVNRQLLLALLKDIKDTNWTRKDRKALWPLAGQLESVALDIECEFACGLND